ncbi:RNA-directed DNA polymerase from mobile element jockey [Hypsizygus marmoreus]|uniref:RNA-directed DNA polymerase from mobile element jockey n=1 Tax=Hypsizygus marmoreus TaxID=39966 RepID=A0A369J8S5_HYPMA|nr:RNA-directed DNA polymerase from mobile element jockey [Hypsizygus marmoreus]
MLGEGTFPTPKVTTNLVLDQPPPKPRSRQLPAEADIDEDPPDAHRGRQKERHLRWLNLQALRSCQTSYEFWQLIRMWTDAKRRQPMVTADQLQVVFEARINPPLVIPAHFNHARRRHHALLMEALPDRTVDHTPECFFSRPFTTAEVGWAKVRIATHGPKSAKGVDGVSYAQISEMDNDSLANVFNACIAHMDAPADWLVTRLVGVPKIGKNPADPESYRLIGLESCMLKVMTLLIDKQLRDWAALHHIIPDSQNGFRETFRTNNNSFVLRCAVDRARATGVTLYVAFIDLTNAFPATNIPTLWSKLFRLGVSGPLFDWLRMLYRCMSYVVQHGGVEALRRFCSLIGLLTGDTASPGLWIIYFADLMFPPDHDDIVLGGRPISHVEQADDVALMSTTPQGLQRKVTYFHGWCGFNSMVISAPKSKSMIFGPLPQTLPSLYVGDAIVALVSSYTYVGVTFVSTARSIFAEHYAVKASKARNVANATFAVETMLGSLAPADGKLLYLARVDPHLISGCEVVIDTVDSLTTELEKVQEGFIRRLLGLGKSSMLALLYTETGLVPIRYRRVTLVLKFLSYLLIQPPTTYAAAAYRDTLDLANAALPGWLSDLRRALACLPVPVLLDTPDLQSVQGVSAVVANVHASCDEWLQGFIDISPKTHLIRSRARGDNTVLKFRHYLHIPVPNHRKSLTRLFLSAHGLAVEKLRHLRDSQGGVIPRSQRLCRFCAIAVEDECHAMLECRGNDRVIILRGAFLTDVAHVLQPSAANAAGTNYGLLLCLINNPRIADHLL